MTDIFWLSYRFQHHAIASGNDRLADFLGSVVSVPKWVTLIQDNILKVPSKLISIYSGNRFYGRRDCILESVAAVHFLRHQHAIYHIVYGDKSYRFLGLLQGKRKNLIGATFHNPPHQYPELYKNYSHFKKLDYATVVSTNQLEFMESLIGKDKVTFVPYGVDTDYFFPVEKSERRCKQIVFSGYHMRDFENLPRIIKGIRSAHPDVQFHLVSNKKACLELSDPQKGIITHARLPDNDYKTLLQQSDVMMLPLKGSTAVSSINEALACGLPVVTHHGGVSDYVTSDCGILVPPGEVNGFIDAVVGVLKDDALRLKLSVGARNRALEFSWSRIRVLMENVFSRAIAKMDKSG